MVTLLKSDKRCILHYDPCKEHGHVRVSRDVNTQCIACDELLKPQEQAVIDGHAVYVSTSHCGGCGKLTLRDVDDRSCQSCGYTPRVKGKSDNDTEDNRATDDSVMMRDNPNMLLSRADAEQYDMRVYRTGKPCKRGHTGWRYVSTGNCIDCLRGDK
jgi:hypothetical protein